MNIKNSIFILLIVVGVLPPSSAFAQEKVLEKIKTEMADLAQKNYELKKRFEEQMPQVYALEQKVKEKRQELRAIEDSYQKKVDKIEKRSDYVKSLYKNMDVVQSDILIKKSKIPFLRKQLLQKEKDFDLLSLRLADLRLHKNDLQARLNENRFSSARQEREIANKLVALRMKLNTNIEKQKNISQLMIELEDNQFTFSQKIQKLLNQNQRLEQKEEELRKKRDLQARENMLLKDKRLLAQKTYEGDIKIRTAEKEQIAEALKEVEVAYHDLAQKIEEALAWKVKRIEYQKEMVAIDKENAGLRKKASELRSKLESLQ